MTAETAEIVQPLIEPDTEQMLRHLEHLFGGYLDGCHDGKIELAWCDGKDGKLKHAAASHAFGGWLAILTAWCEHHGIAYEGVPVGTIKRHITGKGNADKAAVVDAVRRLGFNPADDNEADALALLHWALAQGIGGE